MDGHSGDVYYVAFHPTNPNVFATVADSGHVHMWDASIRQMTHCAALGWKPRSVWRGSEYGIHLKHPLPKECF